MVRQRPLTMDSRLQLKRDGVSHSAGVASHHEHRLLEPLGGDTALNSKMRGHLAEYSETKGEATS
jgi:hypothetical protein